MRYVWSLSVALVIAFVVLAASPSRTAFAAFHCMRIHAVMHGYQGNNAVQYVELRMNMSSQNFLAGHKIEFFDAGGTVKATFTFPAGSPSVPNGALGDSVLIATSEFVPYANGGAPDFTFSGANTVGVNGGDPLHPVQGANGLVHFARLNDNCDVGAVAGPGEVDSLAYGSATAHFGSAAATLPSPADTRALRLEALTTVPSANDAEYELAAVSLTTFGVAPGSLASNLETPRNNGRTVLRLQAPTSVGGVVEPAGSEAVAPISSGSNDDGRPWRGYAYGALAALLALAATGGFLRWRRG
ncbi:MAG: hypothetical protein WD359_01320 [Dehalococcoidia bacterium]